MPSGKPLDESTKRSILRMWSVGRSKSAISRALDVDRGTIIAFLSHIEEKGATFVKRIDKSTENR